VNNEAAFRRIVVISTIVSAPLALASNILPAAAVDFDLGFLANPVDMLAAGLDPAALRLFRWGEILGMFGYLLLLIPLTLYLWYWLSNRHSQVVTLCTVLALISIVLGVIEYSVRAAIWPPLMIAYPQAADSQREVLEVVFKAVTDFSFEGMYALSGILAGLWWLGIGLVLRAEQRVLGIATAILGLAILGAGSGWLLRVDPLARLELFYFFVPLWALWLGVAIWRKGSARH
jgi:hypothetical protein